MAPWEITVLKEGEGFIWLYRLHRPFEGALSQHGGPLRELGGPWGSRFGGSWKSITGSWEVL